ncbi:hypothetical protein FYP93_23240 [Salmonella enterica]|nr:hypothetical protein [Salmonella enterica]EFS2710296.1 hypothetical protein [Salmonella enterica]EIK3036454.1 hypothetical protein [Salmonella enterica]ELZ4130843.1 hypothetical protein [Salmonella enterica]
MIAHTECTTYCLDELSKLTKLLSLLGQSVTDEKTDLDDIEGYLGIAWDMANTIHKTLSKTIQGVE